MVVVAEGPSAPAVREPCALPSGGAARLGTAGAVHLHRDVVDVAALVQHAAQFGDHGPAAPARPGVQGCAAATPGQLPHAHIMGRCARRPPRPRAAQAGVRSPALGHAPRAGCGRTAAAGAGTVENRHGDEHRHQRVGPTSSPDKRTSRAAATAPMTRAGRPARRRARRPVLTSSWSCPPSTCSTRAFTSRSASATRASRRSGWRWAGRAQHGLEGDPGHQDELRQRIGVMTSTSRRA